LAFDFPGWRADPARSGRAGLVGPAEGWRSDRQRRAVGDERENSRSSRESWGRAKVGPGESGPGGMSPGEMWPGHLPVAPSLAGPGEVGPPGQVGRLWEGGADWSGADPARADRVHDPPGLTIRPGPRSARAHDTTGFKTDRAHPLAGHTLSAGAAQRRLTRMSTRRSANENRRASQGAARAPRAGE